MARSVDTGLTVPRPSFAWLRDHHLRRRRRQFWIRDQFFGVTNIVLHSVFRVIPIDGASATGCWHGILAGRYRFRARYARARSNYLRLVPDGASEQQADVAMTRLWGHLGRTEAEFSALD